MAFSYSRNQQDGIAGSLRIVTGTWTSGSSTGGAIQTGLTVVYAFLMTPLKSAVAGNEQVVSSTPATWLANGGAVTIVTDSGVDGLWVAIGY